MEPGLRELALVTRASYEAESRNIGLAFLTTSVKVTNAVSLPAADSARIADNSDCNSETSSSRSDTCSMWKGQLVGGYFLSN